MQLSKNFTLQEFLRSSTASTRSIVNLPNAYQVDNMRRFCNLTLQPFRDYLGKPLIVSSGFRTPALNKAVRGSAGSYHLKGFAADLKCPDMTSFQLCSAFYNYLDKNKISYSLYEIIPYRVAAGGHLHIAFRA